MVRRKVIFIASSGESKPLADALAKKLKSSLNPSPDPNQWAFEIKTWSGGKVFELSGDTLDSLIAQARQSDFAAVLLTRDDTAQKREEKVSLPRDNTVFELGLFIGALGLEPRRCYMLSSVGKDALPSDLAGRTYIEMKQPETLTVGVDYGDYVDSAATQICEAVNKISLYTRPVFPSITKDELADIERSDGEGGKLVIQEDRVAVVVNSAVPVEQLDTEFCSTIVKNMEAGAQYEYYYGPFDDNIIPTANLVQSLAVGKLRTKDMTPERLLQAMKDNWPLVWANLRCMRQCLGIHFRGRPPLQFCVHNAENEEIAICYLRCTREKHDGEFVQWAEKRGAKDIAGELTSSCTASARELSIFHSTLDFPLHENEARLVTPLYDIPNPDLEEDIKNIRNDTRKGINNRRARIAAIMKRKFPQDLPNDQQMLLDQVWLPA